VTPLLARTMLMLGQPEKVTKSWPSVQLTTPEAKADLQTSVGQAYLMQGKPEQAAGGLCGGAGGAAGLCAGTARRGAAESRPRRPAGGFGLLDSALEKLAQAV
jgi:hypothetical protein